MKTEEYLKLYINELTNASKITDVEFERKKRFVRFDVFIHFKDI